MVDLGESFEPGLAALLWHDSVRSPGCERIVESLVCRADRLLAGICVARIIKAGHVAHAVIVGRGHNPGITAVGQGVSESVIVLKKKCRM